MQLLAKSDIVVERQTQFLEHYGGQDSQINSLTDMVSMGNQSLLFRLVCYGSTTWSILSRTGVLKE